MPLRDGLYSARDVSYSPGMSGYKTFCHECAPALPETDRASVLFWFHCEGDARQ